MTCPVSDNCTNITAFVNYEHFDGVSDSKMKPLLHSIIPPATIFCASTADTFILKVDLDENDIPSVSNDSQKSGVDDLTLQQMIVLRSGVWRTSNVISNKTRWKYGFIWNDQKHGVVFKNLRNCLMKNDIKVLPIGSSHMRKNFDLMIEFLRVDLGVQIDSSQNSSVYDGLSWGLNYNATVLAKDQNTL
jgi:hypothetical protein